MEAAPESNNYNHRINLRLEYKIDSFNSLIISPNLNFQKNKSFNESFGYKLDGTDTVNTQDGNSNVFRTGYNLRNNILFRHSFKSNRRRTFSIGFNQTLNKNNGESYIFSNNRTFNGGIPSDSLQNQFIDNPTNGYSLSGNVSYTEPLGPKASCRSVTSHPIQKTRPISRLMILMTSGKIIRFLFLPFPISLKIPQPRKMPALLIVLATPGTTSFRWVLTFSIRDWKATGYILPYLTLISRSPIYYPT